MFIYKLVHGRLPQTGDLIRSENKGDVINLVLQTIPKGETLEIHSVQYAKIAGGRRQLLTGSRVRPFLWYDPTRLKHWTVVREYEWHRYDSSKDIKRHLDSLEGVDLYYRSPNV